MFKQQN